MSDFKLHQKDKKLIYELEIDGRDSISSIARKVEVSKEVAQYRIKRLMDNSVIKEFSAIVNYYNLGFDRYRFLVNLHNLKPGTKKEILAYLNSKHDLYVRDIVQSVWDIQIDTWVKTSSDFYDFYNEFLTRYSSYVQRKMFFLVTKSYHLPHSYLYGKNNCSTVSKTQEIAVDEKDLELLDCLEIDGRMDILSIAHKLKIPVSTARYKLLNLQKKNVIVQIIPQLNTLLYGYETYKIYCSLNRIDQRQMLIEFLLQSKNVQVVREIIGEYDLAFEADFSSSKELNDFLQKSQTLGIDIRDYEIMIVSQKKEIV